MSLQNIIDESKEAYAQGERTYSLIKNGLFLTACLAVKGAIQLYEKGGAIDVLEQRNNDKTKCVVAKGARDVYDIIERYVRPDEEGRISGRSPNYSRDDLIASYKARYGSTDIAGISDKIRDDVKNKKLYRCYQIKEAGQEWSKEQTLEFIKALDILRRLRGFDILGKDTTGQYVFFPFVPISNIGTYNEKFMREFVKGHENREARRNFLKASSVQYAPDKWPDVWKESIWSEDNYLLVRGDDGQMRAQSHEKKPIPHTLPELEEWEDTHLAKPHDKFRYLEELTHYNLVRETAECKNLYDKWVYVRMLFEKFLAALVVVTNETAKTEPKNLKKLLAFDHMAKLLPVGLREFILFEMPLTQKEQILLFNANSMPPLLQENIVDNFREGIQDEVVKICTAKTQQVFASCIEDSDDNNTELSSRIQEILQQTFTDHLEANADGIPTETQAVLQQAFADCAKASADALVPEVKSVITVVESKVVNALLKLKFGKLNKLRKAKRLERLEKLESKTRSFENPQRASAKQRKKDEKQRAKEEERQKQAQQKATIDPKFIQEAVVNATVLSEVLRSTLGGQNQPSTTGSDPTGGQGEPKQQNGDQADNSGQQTDQTDTSDN